MGIINCLNINSSEISNPGIQGFDADGVSSSCEYAEDNSCWTGFGSLCSTSLGYTLSGRVVSAVECMSVSSKTLFWQTEVV